MAPFRDTKSDLFFGLLALESGLIDPDALFAAMRVWAAEKTKPLGRVLVDQGAIHDAQRELLQKEVDSRLVVQNDLEKTVPCLDVSLLTTIGFSGAVSETIRAQAETIASDTQSARTETDPGVTQVGGSTSSGSDDGDFTITTNLPPPDPAAHRFQILDTHASGGLGMIFLALDAELHREVALKQIKDRYACDPTSRSRFLLEAEITGRLEHPGIVPVYGLGTDAKGRLYYAMRFIRGDTLADAITRFHADTTLKLDPGKRSLELRKLLRRFLDVCNTIEYAHGRGVLHRDIKPANIMVGRYGETLVVDWGIAKVTGRADPKRAEADGERPLVAGSGSGATETLAGTTIGSPSYMSPEQASGDLEHLGVESDVYSLGATLYCLVTNRAPIEGDTLKRVLDAAKKGEFLPPREVDRSIDSALEATCLKAMAFKPADRYRSAHALAEDIERWMADEPVSARPEPITERLRRWMRRRRTAVTAGAAAVLVAMVGLAVILWVEARANRELRDANQEIQARFALAQKAIRTYHSGVSEDLLLGQQEFKTLKNNLLLSSLDFYKELESLLKNRSDRPSREALARSYYEVGEVNSMIGSKSVALEAHRNSLALRESLANEPNAGAESMAEVGRSKLAVGWLEKETGDPTAAERDVASARSLLEMLIAKGQSTHEILADLSLTHERMGSLLDDRGQTDEAIGSHERARDIRLDLVRVNPFASAYRASLAKSYQLLGSLLNKRGKPKEAILPFEESRKLRKELVDSNKERPEYQSELASTDEELALVLYRLGKTSEAIDVQERALELRESILKASPNVTKFQDRVARGHIRVGYLLSNTGNPEKAIASYRLASEIWQNLMKSNSKVVNFQADLAAALMSLGSELARTGRTDGALREFVASRAILEKLVQSESKVPRHKVNLAQVYVRSGQVQSNAGRTAEALISLQAARDLQRKLVDAESNVLPRYKSDLAWTLNAISQELARIGRYTEAIGALEEARQTQEGLSEVYPNEPEHQVNLERTRTSLGRLVFKGGNTIDGLAACLRARDRLASLTDANPDVTTYQSDFATTLEELGAILSEAGQDSEARAAIEQARGLCETLSESKSEAMLHRSELASIDVALAVLLTRDGKLDDALALQEQARKVREELERDNPTRVDYQADLAESDDEIAALLSRLGRHVPALEASKRAQKNWKALVNSCPSIATFQVGLSRSLRVLGELLDRSGAGKRDDALEAYRSALAAANSGAGQFRELTVFPIEVALIEENMANLRFRAHRPDEAIALLQSAMKKLEALSFRRPGELIALARVHARLSGIAAAGTNQEEARKEAEAAMAQLLEAVGLGFRSPGILSTDEGFAPLGSRKDFQLLLEDLAFPSKPFRE